MRLGSLWRWLVTALLAASLGLNALLLLRRRSVPPPPAAPAGRAAPRVPTAQRLEMERQASLLALLRDFGERAAAQPAPPRPAPGSADAGTPGGDRELLCEIAREQTRQRWEPFREDLRMLLGWYLSEPGVQERKTVEKTAEIQKLLNLGTREAHELLDDYAGVRRERVAEVRRLLEAEPADWSGVFDQLKGLQADEDRLVRERFGDGPARRLHEALRGERLLALSIIASYAGRPWEDAL